LELTKHCRWSFIAHSGVRRSTHHGSEMNNLHVLFELALVGIPIVGGLLLASRPTLPLFLRALGALSTVAGLGVVVWGVLWTVEHNPADLNPRVKDADVVGEWHCESGVLTLAPDGHFALAEASTWRGTWKRRDWNLDLRDDQGRSEYWRVVRVKDTPVLLRGWRDPAAPWPPECRQNRGPV
jgi:hypothetical protein